LIGQHHLDWMAARLLPEIYDINQRDKYDRVTRRLTNLYRELEPMKFRITEPTFFLHQNRIVGEVMEAPDGPYRTEATGGGLKRIPQFQQITEETKLSKLSELAQRIAKTHKSIEEKADKLSQRMDSLVPLADSTFDKHNAMLDQCESGFKELEDSIRDLAGANGPLPT
jgi:hypothetical protein